MGKLNEQEEARKAIKLENQRIVKAFEQYYDFSDFYFFNADEAEQVRQRQFNGIIKDVNGNSWEPAKNDSLFFPGSLFQSVTKNRLAVLGIPALIIMDQQYQQLGNPFPYSVRTALYGEEEKADKAVQSLNIQFHEYYLDALRWAKKREFKKAKRQFMEENRY